MQTKIDLKKLRLRPYKKCDAKFIVKWSKDEVAFRKWCSDRWQTYPITAEDMNRKYCDNNGDCIDEDNFYPMTLIDNNTVAGHLILRFTDKERTILRFGFVITDDSKRGLGYGKEMLSLALKYSFEILKVNKITLGVFDNNLAAYHCYKSVGFKEIENENKEENCFCGEIWSASEMEMTKDDYLIKVNLLHTYERSSIINLLIIAKNINFRSDSCEYKKSRRKGYFAD